MAVTYGAKSDAAERERWPERPPKKLTALSFSADMTLILSCDEIREKQSPSSIKPLPLSISRGLISWDANVFVELACHYLVGTRWVQSTIKLLDCPRSLSSAAVGTSQQHQNFKKLLNAENQTQDGWVRSANANFMSNAIPPEMPMFKCFYPAWVETVSGG